MKTLYTLGDSFMSSDSREPSRQSFVDQLATHYNLKHVSLARPGASNLCIRLQIDYAIKQQADFVIVGATSSDRIDFVQDTTAPAQRIDLTSIVYRGYHSTSEANVPNSAPWIISDTLNNAVEKTYPNLDAVRQQTVKLYLRDLHCPDIADQRDYYVVKDGLRDLTHYGCPFLFMPGPLFFFDWKEFGSAVWTKTQPWDLPQGVDTLSINHNPQTAHADFFNTALEYTQYWLDNSIQ